MDDQLLENYRGDRHSSLSQLSPVGNGVVVGSTRHLLVQNTLDPESVSGVEERNRWEPVQWKRIKDADALVAYKQPHFVGRSGELDSDGRGGVQSEDAAGALTAVESNWESHSPTTFAPMFYSPSWTCRFPSMSVPLKEQERKKCTSRGAGLHKPDDELPRAVGRRVVEAERDCFVPTGRHKETRYPLTLLSRIGENAVSVIKGGGNGVRTKDSGSEG